MKSQIRVKLEDLEVFKGLQSILDYFFWLNIGGELPEGKKFVFNLGTPRAHTGPDHSRCSINGFLINEIPKNSAFPHKKGISWRSGPPSPTHWIPSF